tara:strand:- start:2488 stop:3279 length:792 start_codon:yes stop_codon:yes gene_type:complete
MAEKGLIERTTDKAKAAINEAETEKNVPKFRKAVDWAMAQSIENHGTDCGICGWKPWSHNKEQSLQAHITRKHRSTIIDLYDNQVLNLSDLSPANPSDDDNELFATAGITRVEDLDRHDFLAVPQAIKDKIEGDGGVGRWVRDDRLEHFKNQGATITQGAHGTNQPSSENGALRTNELTHVTMPHELAERRSRQKEARVNDQLVARAEEIEKTKDKYEKKTYDYLRKERGLDHGKAGQVAKALAGRRQREGGDGNGLRITDGR